ncbi:MAG: toll/interleukin-1 receptor domain-containing protein [Phycisphaeraceae bacterium]
MTTTQPPMNQRDVVFISHANPEDNAFATWLTLRLTLAGYRVWCDVVKLMGGDDFWKDIEQAIRDHTRRFIFVTSRASNQKAGTLQELAVAAGIARQFDESRFIIPVKIDDLPYGDHNIQINRLNALNFTSGWAEGLRDLFKTLEDDAIPRPEQSGASSVASWWNSNRLNHGIVQQKPETLWSNWFLVKNMPRSLWMWNVPETVKLPDTFPYPTYRHKSKLLSFADADALTVNGQFPSGKKGHSIAFNLKREPPQKTGLWLRQIKTATRHMLTEAWTQVAASRDLPLYDMSSRRKTLWFSDRPDTSGFISFDGADGKAGRRTLLGYKTIRQPTGETRKRYWHYGLEAVPILYPKTAIALKPHVIFTNDGKNPIGDPKAQHRARRSQCKDWWNDKWLDTTLAAMKWLEDEQHRIELPLLPDENPYMEVRPIKYKVPVGYEDSSVRIAPQAISPDENEVTDGQSNEEKTASVVE